MKMMKLTEHIEVHSIEGRKTGVNRGSGHEAENSTSPLLTSPATGTGSA